MGILETLWFESETNFFCLSFYTSCYVEECADRDSCDLNTDLLANKHGC